MNGWTELKSGDLLSVLDRDQPNEDSKQIKGEIMRLLSALAVFLIFGAQMSAQEYHEYPANRVTHVNIDQFIGSWLHSETDVTHGVLIERAILSAGDPHKPGPPGAVLEYHKRLSVGVLESGAQTPPVRHAEQEILYVECGTGELLSGNKAWPLHEGIAALVRQSWRRASLQPDPKAKPR